MAPVMMQIDNFKAIKSELFCDKIVRQIFSVITIVKNGIKAVKNVIVRRAVQTEAKQESPAINKNEGMNMLENP